MGLAVTSASLAFARPTAGQATTLLRFMAPWTNTNAVAYVNGDSVGVMTAVDNYCGWFETRVKKPEGEFSVYFRQTVGHKFYGSEGVVDRAPSADSEIGLDSIAAVGDTLWVRGYKSDAPGLYTQYPGALGDCPIRKLPVMMFDWYDGSRDNHEKYNPATRDESLCNLGKGADHCTETFGGVGISSDFGGDNVNLCWPNSPMSLKDYTEEDRRLTDYTASLDQVLEGMVERKLGKNGVPVRNKNFDWEGKCRNAEHLDRWFVPETLVVKDGKGYTNATCRNMTLQLDNDGIWRAQMDSEADQSVGEARGGMFLIDDFQWLDSARTIPNPYYDSIPSGFAGIDGSGKKSNNAYHNYGMSMKVQANFEYVRGQYFEFLGDDDVWVYIDGRLVVDIGGVHDRRNRAVDLDTLGLDEGKTYTFNIFYTERYKVQGNFKMRTSMDLKADATMFLKSYASDNIRNYEVWQVNKRDALSCDFSNSATTTDSSGGASIFRLTGGNLEPQELGVGHWYEGIHITSDSTFSIDSAAIVDNYALAPGHYFLQVLLKSDTAQSTSVEIIIPSYSIPSVAFADSEWKILGQEVSGDTLQIGKWANTEYDVYITFFEDWAQVNSYNRKVNLSASDTLISILGEDGDKITTVNLDENGRAHFRVRANGPVSGATLTAKGAAATAAYWNNLDFLESPEPHVTRAIMLDRNGDGRGDSLFIELDKKLDSRNVLNELQFTFGETFSATRNFKVVGDGSQVVVTASCNAHDKVCGFGARQFTGGESERYRGSIRARFTYKENGADEVFNPSYGSIIDDGMGPIVVKAVAEKMNDGNRLLTLTFSEAITDESRSGFLTMFEYTCMRSGKNETPVNAAKQSGGANTMVLMFAQTGDDVVLPSAGDLVRFAHQGETAMDLWNNEPHSQNPWVTISGNQEVSNESPSLVTIDDENQIIAGAATTQPMLNADNNLTPQEIGEKYGVQGNLLGFNIADYLLKESDEQFTLLESFIETHSGTDTAVVYDTTYTLTREDALIDLFEDIGRGDIGEAYGISEEVAQLVMEGRVTKDNYRTYGIADSVVKAIEALAQTKYEDGIKVRKDTVVTSTNVQAILDAIAAGTFDRELRELGVSEATLQAVKDGSVNEALMNDFSLAGASGKDDFLREHSGLIVSADAVVVKYRTRYYSHLGEYVGGDSGIIDCFSDVYKDASGNGSCMDHQGERLFLAWNMRNDKGRLVGTGVYIGRLELKIQVNGRTILNQTRDKLWGVRRSRP